MAPDPTLTVTIDLKSLQPVEQPASSELTRFLPGAALKPPPEEPREGDMAPAAQHLIRAGAQPTAHLLSGTPAGPQSQVQQLPNMPNYILILFPKCPYHYIYFLFSVFLFTDCE